jgi:CheY-like chemotaxis protein
MHDRPIQSLRGSRVLVVEDDADHRELLQTVLEQHGAVVVTARSAGEALVSFEAQRPHLLISDLNLGDDDGYGLLRALRARAGRAPGRSFSFSAIALTGYASPEDAANSRREGFQAHLAKPVELDAMLDTVATVLREAAG